MKEAEKKGVWILGISKTKREVIVAGWEEE